MINKSETVSRFAPSPTGYLHLGHAYSALFAKQAAERDGGKFLLRIEDIDPARCKEEFVTAIVDDLHWLGLTWEEPIRRQSEHYDDYAQALNRLRDMGLVYPCFCTRKEIMEEIIRSGHAPHLPGVMNEEQLYPGTCLRLSADEVAERMKTQQPAYRLNMRKACALVGSLTWRDREAGEITVMPELFGDVVLARKDIPTSYHLSVVVDDYLQSVTIVTRGVDLFRATSVHRLLQALLNYPTPLYHHHKLLTDDQGKRYAKRDQSLTLRTLRDQGKTPEEIKRLIA